MDPFTALGAAGSLLAIVEATGKLARKLHRVARELKAAKKHIERLASEVTIFSGVLYSVYDCLDHHYKRCEELKIVDNQKRKTLIDVIAKQAMLTIGEVKELCPRMKDLKSLIELWEKFKWLQRKSDVAELRLQMISLGASVNTLMSCVTYEDNKLQGVDAKILEISRRHMKNCNRTAEEINARHRDAVLQNGSQISFSAFSEIQDLTTEVFEEEMEIVKSERTAAANAAEPDPSHLSRSRRSPRPYRNGHHSRRRNAVASSRHATQSSLALPRLITGDGPSSSVPADPEPPPAPASSQMALARGTLYPLGNTAIQTDTVRSRGNDSMSQILDDALYTESHDVDRDLPSELENYEIVTVHIWPIGNEPMMFHDYRGRQTDARLYRNFNTNIISQNLALELGLDVRFTSANSDEAMATHQKSGSGSPNPIVGYVQFLCNDCTLALPVHCAVVSRHTIHGAPLVLGRPYVRQMEEARNGRRRESLIDDRGG